MCTGSGSNYDRSIMNWGTPTKVGRIPPSKNILSNKPVSIMQTLPVSDSTLIANEVVITRVNNLITIEQMQQMWPSVSAEKMRPIMDELNSNLEKYKLDTSLRKAYFIGQVRQEVGPNFNLREDIGRYTASNLKSKFSYYRNSTDEHEAERDANLSPRSLKEETITNKVYMDVNRPRNARLGNVEAGDGYRFIGRGLKQTTGRYNYEVFNKKYPAIWEDEGLNFLETPELLEEPKYAVRSAVVFWLDKKLYENAEGSITDDKINKVSRGVNRYDSDSAYANRRKFTKQAAEIFL